MNDNIQVFFVTNSGTIVYDKDKHSKQIWNFLYWEASEDAPALLIAGDGKYGRPDSSHHSLYNCFCYSNREGRNDIPVPPDSDIRKPEGAGGTALGLSWKSEGFEVNTPGVLRPIIAEALGLPLRPDSLV